MVWFKLFAGFSQQGLCTVKQWDLFLFQSQTIQKEIFRAVKFLEHAKDPGLDLQLCWGMKVESYVCPVSISVVLNLWVEILWERGGLGTTFQIPLHIRYSKQQENYSCGVATKTILWLGVTPTQGAVLKGPSIKKVGTEVNFHVLCKQCPGFIFFWDRSLSFTDLHYFHFCR